MSYLLLPKHVSLGDAVEQRVGDLACSTGHHNTNGFGLQGTHSQAPPTDP